jgi:hypothetical protein
VSTGAYGLTLSALSGAECLLIDGPPESWPEWDIRTRRGDGSGRPHVGEATATVPLFPAGRLDVERRAACATLTMPEPPGDEAIAHPYLAPVAAIAALWLGRQAFHAGAFVHSGAAWVVLGDKGEGKSSLLAALAARGNAVLADDLVVVDRGDVLAGPRCIDLRADSAAALGEGNFIGNVAGRERYRVRLGAAPPALPLAGWIRLGWADEAVVESVPPAVRVPAILAAMALRVTPPDPTVFVDLAARPMLALRRPRDYGSAALEALIAAAEHVA